MTAIEAVAVHLPERRVPIESLADELGLTSMQLKLFRRYHRLAEIRHQPAGDLADLLCGAVANLKTLVGREEAVRYVIHARTFPVVSPYPHNPLHQVRARFGLDRAVGFTVTHQACASACSRSTSRAGCWPPTPTRTRGRSCSPARRRSPTRPGWCRRRRCSARARRRAWSARTGRATGCSRTR
ncbi:hypothetical protein ACFQX7_37160 [Luedemannella flava]